MSRQTCSTCLRPVKVCYCSALVKVANRIRVLIIQHPLEEKHPFNTGRIAHLCLENSELIVAEQLPAVQWRQILTPTSVLLYPSFSWLPEAPLHTDQKSPDAAIEQLVVIDATWRKSKKMLYLNTSLQQLPRISLEGGIKSNYRIRHSSLDNSLSTLEGIVGAMEKLDPEQDLRPILAPFERMIVLQQRCAESSDG